MNRYKKKYTVILDNMDLYEYRLRPISAIMYLQDAFARYTATKRMAAYDLFASNQYWVVNGTPDEIRPYRILYKCDVWMNQIKKAL